jgi:hypothetical protein
VEPTAVPRGDGLGDRQAQAGAVSGPGGVGLAESFEGMGEERRIEAWPVVAHLHRNHEGVVVGAHPHRDWRCAVFDGIVNEIGDGTVDLVAVAVHGEAVGTVQLDGRRGVAGDDRLEHGAKFNPYDGAGGVHPVLCAGQLLVLGETGKPVGLLERRFQRSGEFLVGPRPPQREFEFGGEQAQRCA